MSRNKAYELGKEISVAILDAGGRVLLISKGDNVGIHNTEAARRKAYTAVSTKTSTLILARNARSNPDTQFSQPSGITIIRWRCTHLP